MLYDYGATNCGAASCIFVGKMPAVTRSIRFRAGRSSEDQLLLTDDEVAESIDSGCIVNLDLLDYLLQGL